jgi:hypothetical protein
VKPREKLDVHAHPGGDGGTVPLEVAAHQDTFQRCPYRDAVVRLEVGDREGYEIDGVQAVAVLRAIGAEGI